MNSSLGRSLFLGVLLVTLVAGLFVVARRIKSNNPDNQPETTIQPIAQQATPAFDVVLLQTQATDRRLVSCHQQHCQNLTPPPSDKTNAVTDGQSWYHYIEDSLYRTWINSGQSQVIADKTPLIAFRDLIISPDNNKVAYWLDNIDQPEERLTELWVYDAEQSGTKLLAEKLVQNGIATRIRWNKASSHLWFVGDDRKLNVISTQPPGIALRFSELDWDKLKDIADHGVMDISLTGQSLALTEPTFLGRSKLVITSQDRPPLTLVVRGGLPYLQWLDDNKLLFVTQGSQDFTFWLFDGSTQQQIARHSGKLLSIHTDNQNNFAIFASQLRQTSTRLFALNIERGNIADLNYEVSDFGQRTHLVHVEAEADQSGSVAGLMQVLDDDQLAAFIEKKLSDIVHQTNVQQKRLTITDKPNTVYVDYRDGTGTSKRLLLTVKDAIHPEWSVAAYFEEVSGEWVKTQGGGLAEPKPLRLYEWEEKLEQWILKEEY
ncbi:MAG: hypothetical protein ABIH36_00155 [bacterium]